ncbi:MAG: alanine--tRNA ligase [Chloroflexota bacterium]
MPPRSSDEIRADFVQFWLARGGHLQPSSSLIPYNDPTVLLTTAGMQQFVPVFLGKERLPHQRYVSIQKCFRTSDIDEVGDRSHLTFFEMLGNFSIGAYFKAEVIPWALEFSTSRLGLDQERLWITIHDSDDEANEIWLEAGLPQDRIKRFGDEHNWWGPPGKSGPCGPNTELYYAQGPGFGCGFPDDPPGCECGRLEFWNLVFMQFNQNDQGLRTPLPARNVDTGMGLERASVVALGLRSIYDTDLFQPILQAAERIATVEYGRDPSVDFALRVLADHARGMTLLALDGVVPGTGGREYVLRRIVRRAIRYGRSLGIDRPFVVDLVDAVVDRMGANYPDLVSDAARISHVLTDEEELFGRTLQSGSLQIERLVSEARSAGVTLISGERAFDLYQTHGFPVELTEEMLREQGFELDRVGFEAALSHERDRARSGGRFALDQRAGDAEFGDLPKTDFLAWTDTQTEARVLAVTSDGDWAPELGSGRAARLVLEASPFYPKGGGQEGDVGWIRTPGGLFVVDDTQFDAAGHIVHYGRIHEGVVRMGELARAEVNAGVRDRSRRHHTATHLLHRALKDVLGEGTSQQGSYVGADQLRFDFNYSHALDRDQLQEVTSIINDRGMDDLPVHWEIMPMHQARQLGAIMMFGEKYGDQVRVVSIGEYSRELCGGTHTHHSGELGAVVIASESGIGSGKRRIVAYAGRAALAYLQARLRLLETLAERVGAHSAEEVEGRLDALFQEIDGLRRDVQRRQQRNANDAAAMLAAHARDVRGIKVVAEAAEHASRDDLERLVDAIRHELVSGVVVLGSVDDGKIQFVVGVTKDLTARIKAGDVVKQVAGQAGGGGGGRPEFATGGGTQPAKLDVALQHAFTVVDNALQMD